MSYFQVFLRYYYWFICSNWRRNILLTNFCWDYLIRSFDLEFFHIYNFLWSFFNKFIKLILFFIDNSFLTHSTLLNFILFILLCFIWSIRFKRLIIILNIKELLLFLNLPILLKYHLRYFFVSFNKLYLF